MMTRQQGNILIHRMTSIIIDSLSPTVTNLSIALARIDIDEQLRTIQAKANASVMLYRKC